MMDAVPLPPFDDDRYTTFVIAFRESHRYALDAYGCLYGCCTSAVAAMTKRFPELRVAKGYVGYAPAWDDGANEGHGHWWCVRVSDGAIIDPTACQFYAELGGRFPLPDEYEEHDDSKHGKLPTGKCPNCGEMIYTGDYLHPGCEAAYRAYLGCP